MEAISMIATLLFPAFLVVMFVDAYTFDDYARGYFDLNRRSRS